MESPSSVLPNVKPSFFVNSLRLELQVHTPFFVAWDFFSYGHCSYTLQVHTPSVAILVDRVLGWAGRVAGSAHMSHHVVMLYFGGPDDREALSYVGRMVEHLGINLTVMWFVPGESVSDAAIAPPDDTKILTVVTDMERERQVDDEFVGDFRLKNVSNESIVYMEKVLNNGEETVAAIRELDSINDLYIVGRGQGMVSPLIAGLTDWSECPELGPIGDLLSSSDFAATVSVLVVPQYVGSAHDAQNEGSPGGHHQMDMYMHNNRRAAAHQRPQSPVYSPTKWSNSPLGP